MMLDLCNGMKLATELLRSLFGTIADAALSARDPLLRYKHWALEEVPRYSLVVGDPQSCEGHALRLIKSSAEQRRKC